MSHCRGFSHRLILVLHIFSDTCFTIQQVALQPHLDYSHNRNPQNARYQNSNLAPLANVMSNVMVLGVLWAFFRRNPLQGILWVMPYLYRSFFAKEPLIIGHFCGKWPVKIRHPMGGVHFSFHHMTHSCVRHDSTMCVGHDSFVCVITLIHRCNMTRSYVWVVHVCVTRLIHMCDMTHWMSHVMHTEIHTHSCNIHAILIHICVTWLIHICVTWLIHICVTWLIHVCDITHFYVWHDSFHTAPMSRAANVSRDAFIYVWRDSFIYVWHDSFIRVTWLIHMCDMTHSCVWHDSFICVTWLISYRADVTCRKCVTWLIYICVTWLIHICDMTHSYVWHDSFLCVTWLISYRADVTCRETACLAFKFAWMSHVTHMKESRHAYERVMSRLWISLWISYVTRMDESCHTYGWVMSHVWMRHVTHMNASRHTYECFMSYIWTRHDPYVLNPPTWPLSLPAMHT